MRGARAIPRIHSGQAPQSSNRENAITVWVASRHASLAAKGPKARNDFQKCKQRWRFLQLSYKLKIRMKKIHLALALIALAIVARVLPHPANFAPIGAVALFGGIYLSRRYAMILPLAAMLISDIFIGFYTWQIMVSVYVSFALTGLIGLRVRKNKKLSTIVGGTVLGSILFFLITNFAVWAFGAMYAHNLAGLTQSYIMAIPFFRNSLLGDLFYVGLLVGSYEAIGYFLLKKKAPVTV